ncbi:arginyltransferase [Culex quinquefasciatus]|uniref:Arginyltransferase n=1 Tax=Culex quinquefasciatus TaxID=7176 RepID=B0X3H3_CULQU|nr:arginyltransferase [Culex quinquefasciatus]|eukprot:XP_001864195.1 arginyltransferase [Culex quinquefasciatus]
MDEAVNGSEEDLPGVEFESDFLSALKSGGDEITFAMFSIVDFYGKQANYSCGYCKQPNLPVHVSWN